MIKPLSTLVFASALVFSSLTTAHADARFDPRSERHPLTAPAIQLATSEYPIPDAAEAEAKPAEPSAAQAPAPEPAPPPASQATETPAPQNPPADAPAQAAETPAPAEAPSATTQTPPPTDAPAATAETPAPSPEAPAQPAEAPAQPSEPAAPVQPVETPAPAESAPAQTEAAPATTPEAPVQAVEAGPQKRHALSLIGEPKYGPDFTHFAYVNPDAPKGGATRQWALGSFDTLNIAAFKGEKPTGLSLTYDQLFDTSLDEASTEYALIAEWASHPDDYSSVTFKIRDIARWHDGQPITPEDVIFSMDALKAGDPGLAQYYKNVVRSEKTGEREVTFYFDVKNNRELPVIVSQLTVLPKHYWTANGADGAPRDITKTTLEAPLGSGPYKITEAAAPRFIVYQRAENYWAKDLPVRKGFYNFNEIRFDYYRDQTVAFEAFKAGQIDFFTETSAKNWATGYDFPGVKNSQVIKRGDIELKTPEPMQAFILNTRRPKFSDARVRRAFNLAFDFEWANQNLFFGQYKRTGSFFQNTELAAKGLPEGEELAILEEVRAQVPPEVFTTEYKNPVNSTPDEARQNRRDAVALLKDAGWTVRTEVQTDENCGFFCRIMTSVGLQAQKTAPVLRNAAGEAMEVEFLLVSPQFERIVLPYIQNLNALGVKSTLRVIDTPQYKRRTDDFDFDIIVGGIAQSESPGNEQRDYWGSPAADTPGSRNDIGIKNPAVDKLIDRIIFAKNRSELIAASRALDRVLLWNFYVVPQWHTPNERIAYWDKFAHPQTLPSRAVGYLQVWWHDDERAAKLKASQ